MTIPDDNVDHSLDNFKPMGWMWDGHFFEFDYDESGEIVGHHEVEPDAQGVVWSGEGRGFSWEIGPGDDEAE